LDAAVLLDFELDRLGAVVHADDGFAEVNVCAVLLGLQDKDVVKTGAVHLQGEVFAFAVFVAKIKGGVVVLIGEGDAVFELEGFVFYDVQHACFFQHVHAQRQ